MAEFIKKTFDFSMKNIPYAGIDSVMKSLIFRTEDFINRFRWVAIFFLKDEEDRKNGIDVSIEEDEEERKETYGFRTSNIPQAPKEIAEFENDLWSLVESVEFDTKKNKFQNKLHKELKEIQKSENLLVPADKTSNMYSVKPETYKKLMKDNITQNYKKVNRNEVDKINKEAKKIAKKFDIDDRVEKMPEKNAFITLKDHKANFMAAPQCRLINPTKSEMGKVSKHILSKINQKVREKTKLKQWICTSDAIEWFQKIDNKREKELIVCDIEAFYPSITRELLDKAITFAEQFTLVSGAEREAILHSRKTVLIDGEDVWCKKDSNFDVAMGAYDGAEVAELVGLMLLWELKENVPDVDFGLYRDDGLGVMSRENGPKTESIRKKIVKTFKDNGLKITIQMRLHKVDYLDVTFDMMDNTYSPYRKPGDNVKYIDSHSNHPPHIKKELPKMIEKRITSLSKNRDIFERSAKEYSEVLKQCGYRDSIQYNKNTNRQKADKKEKKKRKRKVVWYNPPFHEQMKTDIGRQFLKLIDKHFGKKRKDNLHKIFNRKTVKISYSCTPNFGTLIKQHNNRIMDGKKREERAKNDKKCNCRVKAECPLKEECMVESVVYKATVTSNEERNIYIGSTEGSFKQRYTQHKSDIRNEKGKNKTTLSKYMWDMKEKGKHAEIEWSILKKCKKYGSGSRRCDVCLSEKLEILKAVKKGEKMLNKRSELMYKCPHRRKFLLVV